MPGARCKAKTESGKPCRLKAGASGYCYLHDPERGVIGRRRRLDEVLNVVYATCAAKGWRCLLSSCDTEKSRYASVTVDRSVSTGLASERIAGVLDITVDESGVQASMHKTSFSGHGLADVRDSIQKNLWGLPWLGPPGPPEPELVPPTAVERIVGMLTRFHSVARQLGRRREGRATLVIGDEYDVQDLLHAVLKGLFDDVRPEESTPSYAGACSRTDFLLKNEQIVVEAKMASSKLRDRQVGEELIIDMKRYQSHPDCKVIICLVYDPDHHIRNPAALENDLSGKHDGIEVRVLVVPQ